MRSALTVATRHSGEAEILHLPGVDLELQKAEFRKLRDAREHPIFRSVEIWERSQGMVKSVKFEAPLVVEEGEEKRPRPRARKP